MVRAVDNEICYRQAQPERLVGRGDEAELPIELGCLIVQGTGNQDGAKPEEPGRNSGFDTVKSFLFRIPGPLVDLRVDESSPML